MKSALLGVAVAVLAGSTAGCHDPVRSSPIPPSGQAFIFHISKINAPDSVLPGVPLSVVLTALSGGCARFDRIETEKNSSGASVTVWGVNPQIGNPRMACTADLRVEPHTLTFDPPFASSFTIVVNRPPPEAPLVARVEVR